MPAKVVRMLSGADSVVAANALLLATQDRRNEWPYVHIYPPPNSTDVLKIGTIQVQDPMDPVIEILRYTVSSGKLFYLTGVVLGADVTFSPGDCLITVDRNSPIGIANSQFQPEHGLVNVPVQLGSFNRREWRFKRPREFAANDVIRVKGLNVSMTGSAFYLCGLIGFEVPTLDVKAKR